MHTGGRKKSFLFDIGHPAHFHLFKNTIRGLIAGGHDVIVTGRDKDVTVDLLARSGFPFAILSRKTPGRFALLRELLHRDVALLKLARRHGVDVMAGTSASISHVSRLTRARAVVFQSDDADVVPGFAWLAYPAAHSICTPQGVRTGRWQRKQVTYPGYHELAYLHPDHFTPDPAIATRLGLPAGAPYAVVRLSAMDAHHDTRAQGIAGDRIQQVIALLERHCRVFVSAEKPSAWAEGRLLPLPPDRIHDVLAGAVCLVSDSQTMTREAAVLGVPAFRCNTFVGRLSVLEELEKRYGLAQSFLPPRFDCLLEAVEALLSRKTFREEWRQRRERMLAEKINVAVWMAEYLKSV